MTRNDSESDYSDRLGPTRTGQTGCSLAAILLVANKVTGRASWPLSTDRDRARDRDWNPSLLGRSL